MTCDRCKKEIEKPHAVIGDERGSACLCGDCYETFREAVETLFGIPIEQNDYVMDFVKFSSQEA